MKEVIALKGLTKNFGKIIALDNINLQIYEGEIFGLLGPNGSGKTTLLKILLGLLSSTKGEVFIFGKPHLDTLIKNRIGFLPEIPQYYPFLNPVEVLDFYARLFNIPKKIRRVKAKELLDLVGLYDYRKRRLGVFSKGMLQRIGLAVSLVNDPELLLLDEPTVGLDPIGSLEIRDLFLKLKAKGKTILLCSHLLSEAEYACDRIGILYKAKLIKEGRLSEILKKQDEIQINIRPADEKDKERILEFFKENTRQIKIDHPRQSLEEFFYKIIRESEDVS